MIYTKLEQDLIKTELFTTENPSKVDGRRRRRIGNAVVDFAAQFGFGWLWLGFQLGLGCSLTERVLLFKMPLMEGSLTN